MKIASNLSEIRSKIRLLEQNYLRKNDSVMLLAVSKTRSADEIIVAVNEDQRHFGENYCQEAIEKIETINNPNLIWHFIGPVQSNKTAQIAINFDWVHTVDRIKIARRLNEQRPDDKTPLNICIQINISGEKSKSGIQLEETENFIREIESYEKLKLRGLMTLPAPASGIKEQRKPFAELHKYFNRLKRIYPNMDTLSMGTTDDMEAAIAEGSTMVRIGTAIFGPRNASR